MKTVLLEWNNAYCFLLLCFPGEDEDSPMIRGFSDDEPLVIA